VKLSICIPTYNFGRFIGATLESIVPQLTDEVEVVVLDGASTDDTAEVVRRFQARPASIRYHRLDARGGIDRDMARVVELAQGSYCWLFSSDDIMRPGAIATVLRWIGSRSDVYLCRHSDCTFDMTFLADHPVLRSRGEVTADLSVPGEQLAYFALAETTEAFFSFMSGLVVRKAKWDSVPLNEQFMGSCWGHVARLFELMPRGLQVTYNPEVLLDRRGDNDSFTDQGTVNRFRIAIEGYHRIAASFLGRDGDLAFHVRRVVRNEYGFRQFMVAAIDCRRSPGKENKALLATLIQRTYSDTLLQGWLLRMGIALTPGPVYLWLRVLYRYRRKMLTAFRR
jgi:abequosyltransferase